MYDDHSYCDECGKHSLACWCMRRYENDVQDVGVDRMCWAHPTVLQIDRRLREELVKAGYDLAAVDG